MRAGTVCAVILAVLTTVSATADPVVLHVSPHGSSEARGTREAPFATLEQARDALRVMECPDGAHVIVHGGRYQVTQPFVLTAEDSGGAAAPIRYTISVRAGPRARPAAILR